MLTPDQVRDREVHAHVNLGLEGIFEVELIDAETGVVKRFLRFRNVIVDNGMDALGQDNPTGGGPGSLDSLTAQLAVGTSSTAPAQTDAALGTEVARTGRKSDSAAAGTNNDYWERTLEFEFGKLEANDNLTELGLFNDPSTGTMWCRQLFKDAQGNNTTITKTSDDILRVRYIYRIYPDKTVKTKNVDINVRGTLVTTTISYQPQQVDGDVQWGLNVDGLLGQFGNWGSRSPDPPASFYEDNTAPGDFISGGPLDNSNPDSSATSATRSGYSAGNFFRDVTIKVGATGANFATGIGAMAWSDFAANPPWLMLFDPKIDKTSQDELEITVRVSWSRVAV